MQEHWRERQAIDEAEWRGEGERDWDARKGIDDTVCPPCFRTINLGTEEKEDHQQVNEFSGTISFDPIKHLKSSRAQIGISTMRPQDGQPRVTVLEAPHGLPQPIHLPYWMPRSKAPSPSSPFLSHCVLSFPHTSYLFPLITIALLSEARLLSSHVKLHVFTSGPSLCPPCSSHPLRDSIYVPF